ncbi:MAG TPA: hypothetical protein VGJ26_02075 [Pirellulales bacterium]|jgi:hypothetical protein
MSSLEPPDPPGVLPTAPIPAPLVASIAPPKPGWLLIVSAVLVIAQSVFWTALAATGFNSLKLFEIVACMVILWPLAILVAWSQYAAIVRHSLSAANRIYALLFFLCSMWGLFLVVTLGEGISKGINLRFSWWLFAIVGAVVFQLLIAARESLRWKRTLATAESAGYVSQKRTYTLREMFAATGYIAAVLGVSTAMMRDPPAKFGEHVKRNEAPEDVPAGATDLSFGRGHRGTIAYEFLIDEQGFVDWVNAGLGSIEAQSSGAKLREINGSASIRRYPVFIPNHPGETSATVLHGLEYLWSKEDRGVHAIFDRDTNRAYYEAHYH